MAFLFDNNAFKLLLAGEENTGRRVRDCDEAIHLSSVAVEEFIVGRLDGINRARSPRNSLSLVRAHEDFAQALEDVRLLPVFIYSDAAEHIYQTFPASKKRIGAQDCRIAAQALAHGLTVVTRNLRDFEAIGAPCVDWSV